MPAQKQELKELEDQSGDMFSVEPSWMHILQHDIKTPLGLVIWQWPYWDLETKHQAIEAEVAHIAP